MGRSVLLAVAGAVLTVAGLAAQESRCADCHLADPEAPSHGHVVDWERSAHGRNDIGCEKCHGGDASTFDRYRAHLGVLGARNPASLVHRSNLPSTCGRCHPGPFVAFQRSHHYEMLRVGDPAVPVCTTCHGDVAAHLLSARALEARCERCHAGEGVGPTRPEFPPQARRLLEGIGEVRELLERARPLIRRVRVEDRRVRLEEAWRQAEVPLVEATEAGHAFVFEALEERLEVARERADALLQSLVNP